MAIKNIDKFATLRAPAQKIRDSFYNYLQVHGNYGIGRAESGEFTFTRETKYIDPIEYSVGTTYIVDTSQTSPTPPTNPFIIRGTNETDRFVPKTFILRGGIYSIADDTNSTTNMHNLRGYLTTITAAEYANLQAGQRVSRLFTYLGASDEGGFYTTIIDTASRRVVDETEQYKNYLIPVITWYYNDDTGNIKDDKQHLRFLYFFAANKIQRMTGQAVTTSVVKKYSVSSLSQTNYISFSPPYMRDPWGTLTNGVLYPEWQTTREYVCYRKNTPEVPYVMLGVFNDYQYSQSDCRAFADEVGLGFSTSYAGAWLYKNFAAYKSVDDIIDLFADYGVKLYTNEDDAKNPPPSDDGTINPGNPSEEIPYYPDNSTEKTPIEQAYITPSTFGQSCVYTPITTKDFLRWICDNTVDVGNWGRLFANPVDVILGINLYNLDIVAHDTARTNYNAQTNILGVSTNIPNYSILDGYNNIVDGGTLNLQAYYGNYADFTSMTYQMFIPFVGFTTLRACDVVNRTLHLYYAVDFATGAAVAFVNSDDRLIYTSPCNVAGKIPVSTSDKNSQMINNTLSGISAIGGLLGGIASGNVGGGVGALLNGLGGMQMQTNYTNKGGLSAVNIYKLLPAFIERTRYDLFFPSGEQRYLGARYQGAVGAPSTQFDTLLNCVDANGFVQADDVYLTAPTATDAEKEQIIAQIKTGIYL